MKHLIKLTLCMLVSYFVLTATESVYDPSIHSPVNIIKIAEKLEKDNELEIAISILKAVEKEISSPKVSFFIGKLLKNLKKHEEALEYLDKAYAQDPTNAEALLYQIEVYRAMQKLDKVEELLGIIKSDNPTIQVKIMFERAGLHNAKDRPEEALKIYEHLLRILPDNKTILCNYAYTLRILERVPEAVIYYDKAIESDPSYGVARFAKALTSLTNGDFLDGFAGYELRRKFLKTPSETLYTKKTLWDGKTSIKNKRIFVYAEQGLGDTFQFIRYAHVLKKYEAYVILAVQKRLKEIISLCPYIDEVITTQEEAPEHDFYAPLMSLPAILKTTIGTIPCAGSSYLFAEEKLVEYWGEKLKEDENFKIGINFQGSGHYINPFSGPVTSHRGIPAKDLIEALFQIPNVTIYCLQRISGLDELTDELKNKIVLFDADFDQKHGAFMDTAAVMKHLDLVISIDTSIVHLAGGLQVPTLLLLPKSCDWRWMLNRNDTPWYSTVRLIRQKENKNWNYVISQIKKEVKKRIKFKIMKKPQLSIFS